MACVLTDALNERNADLFEAQHTDQFQSTPGQHDLFMTPVPDDEPFRMPQDAPAPIMRIVPKAQLTYLHCSVPSFFIKQRILRSDCRRLYRFGVAYVGQLIQLSPAYALAWLDHDLHKLQTMHHRLREAGLDFNMRSAGWQTDTGQIMQALRQQRSLREQTRMWPMRTNVRPSAQIIPLSGYQYKLI